MKRREFLRKGVVLGATALLPNVEIPANTGILSSATSAIEPLMPIWEAATGGHWGIVKELLRLDFSLINVRVPHDDGNSLLGMSVRHGNVEMMKWLIDHGANVNGDTVCCLPLHEAVHSDKIEAITVLLDNGADIEGMGNSGVTPLLHASACNQTESIKLLLERGADIHARSAPNKWGEGHRWTPLHVAASVGAIDSMRLLLEAGADTEALDQFGKTPLDYAIEMSKESFVRMEFDQRTLNFKIVPAENNYAEAIELLRRYNR